VRRIDQILHNEIHQAPQGRSSQSMGISTGRFALATPAQGLGRTATTATRTRAHRERSRSLRRLLAAAIGSLALAAAVVTAIVWFTRRHQPENTSSSLSAATARVSGAPSRPDPNAHETRYRNALHALQTGATCADRKKAIPTLVELGDPRAIAALKKARARGKPNWCLRATSDEAIKTLSRNSDL
jgi:hypothetical protein